MKQKFVYVGILLVLVVSMLPLGVFASSPQNLRVDVRNHVGVEVDLRLKDSDGKFSYLTIPEGVTEFALTEGIYEYYAVLPCGVVTGTWNVNIVKTLFISCHKGATVLFKRVSGPNSKLSCQYFGFYDSDFQGFLDGDTSETSPDFMLIDGNSANYDIYYEYFNGPFCLDAFMSIFYGIEGWQLYLINSVGDTDLLDSDPGG